VAMRRRKEPKQPRPSCNDAPIASALQVANTMRRVPTR
jgi:hypothetical protein